MALKIFNIFRKHRERHSWEKKFKNIAKKPTIKPLHEEIKKDPKMLAQIFAKILEGKMLQTSEHAKEYALLGLKIGMYKYKDFPSLIKDALYNIEKKHYDILIKDKPRREKVSDEDIKKEANILVATKFKELKIPAKLALEAGFTGDILGKAGYTADDFFIDCKDIKSVRKRLLFLKEKDVTIDYFKNSDRLYKIYFSKIKSEEKTVSNFVSDLKKVGYTVADFKKAEISASYALYAFKPEELLTTYTKKEVGNALLERYNNSQITLKMAIKFLPLLQNKIGLPLDDAVEIVKSDLERRGMKSWALKIEETYRKEL